MLFALLAGSAGCEGFPKDPEHSLAEILETGHVRVGVVFDPPWTTDEGAQAPGGVEPRIIEAWADELGVSVEWHRGSEQSLFEQLGAHQLDVVMGGLAQSNPWRKHAGFSLPWYVSEVRIGVPLGQPAPKSLDGLEVTTRPKVPWISHLRQKGAVVELDETLSGDRTTAVEAWEMEALGLEPTEHRLSRTRHVIAVPSGENALLMSLERRFLGSVTSKEIEQNLSKVATR